jgi:hypothetical protein
MILGGGQCQKCKCIPCDPCEQECTEPHTGDAYEVVYTHYNLGVQAGNLSDGYLTASGDNDTSDPLDGMDGNGPWYQQIEGGFSFGPSVTRNPCTVRVSFWRNSFTLGPTVFPPPAATLTLEEVTVTCASGKIRVGETVLEEGETYTYTGSIPLVAGGGDKSEDDPRTFEGTLAIQPVCREASFEVKARIEWNTKQRQHVLYGLVRECYEVGTPCDDFCDGDPAPSEVYLTISNYTGPSLSGESVEGTYVLERVSNYCDWYLGSSAFGCTLPGYGGRSAGDDSVSAFLGDGGPTITATFWHVIDGQCRLLVLWVNTSYNPTTLTSQCVPGEFGSNTNGVVLVASSGSLVPTTDDIVEGSFDWEISA